MNANSSLTDTESTLAALAVASFPPRLLDLVDLLRRSWLPFLLIALPLPLLAGAMSLLSVRQYKAGASFMPQQSNSPRFGIGAVASELGILGAARADVSPQFYADLLVSRSLLRAVVLTVFDTEGAPPFHGTLVEYFDQKGGGQEKDVLGAIRALDGCVLVTTSRATGVVSFEVRTRGRELSLAIVQRFLELLNDFNLNRLRLTGKAEREFLEGRVSAAERSLLAEEEHLASFLSRNRSLSNSPELAAELGRIERRISLRQQVFVGLSQALEAARTDEVRDTPVITVVERPEDSLEPMGRGTIIKTLVALFAGTAIALAVIRVRGHRSRSPRASVA